MTKPIIVVKVPCKLLYVIQVKEFLIKCSTSWPYLISEFLVAYITNVASDWPRTFFTPKVFLFSIIDYQYSYVEKFAKLSSAKLISLLIRQTLIPPNFRRLRYTFQMLHLTFERTFEGLFECSTFVYALFHRHEAIL